MKEGLALESTAILIGIAPSGGGCRKSGRRWLGEAIDAGSELWSGLHTFLGDDPEFAATATTKGVRLHDVAGRPQSSR